MKRQMLLVGLNKQDVSMVLETIQHYFKDVRGMKVSYFKASQTLETETEIYKDVTEKGLSTLDGYICKEFLLTPQLLKLKRTEEIAVIIDFCKSMQIKMSKF